MYLYIGVVNCERCDLYSVILSSRGLLRCDIAAGCQNASHSFFWDGVRFRRRDSHYFLWHWLRRSAGNRTAPDEKRLTLCNNTIYTPPQPPYSIFATEPTQMHIDSKNIIRTTISSDTRFFDELFSYIYIM